MNARFRPMVVGILVVVLGWALAFLVYRYVGAARMTPEKVRAYIESVQLASLGADDRARTIRELAERLNALSYEDRRRLRAEGLLQGWFKQMTESEQVGFIEATMPTGFQQMLTAFEKLPEDRRQRMVTESLRRLQTLPSDPQSGESPFGNGARGEPIVISEEVRQKITTIGLRTYYSSSSAQTKAELAPLLEELQNSMRGVGSGPHQFRHR